MAENRPRQPDKKRVNFWDRAHQIRHLAFLREQAPTIVALEERLEDIFVKTDVFQPSAVQPVLESIDFKNNRHLDIVQYLSLYQTVTSRKLVGRQMGLLLWDDGQTGHRPLIGAAILASPRFSQRMRDRYFGWPKSYPRKHVRFVQTERDLRLRGLGRMMQLSIVCALPPYTRLSGAWLAAAAPFTTEGQQAFQRSCRKESDPDLASVVTTTSKDLSGAPFRGHRVVQLSKNRAKPAPGAKGDLFHCVVKDDVNPLRASFRSLVSLKTFELANEIYRRDRPLAYEAAKDKNWASLRYVLRRLRLRVKMFDGNRIGIHVGMLGEDTHRHLSLGVTRPAASRLRLQWEDIVQIWLKRFLPASTDETETHKVARRGRFTKAGSYSDTDLRLSYRLKDDPHLPSNL